MSSSRSLKVYTDETQTCLVFELSLINPDNDKDKDDDKDKDKDDVIRSQGRERFVVDASTFHTVIDGVTSRAEDLVERDAAKYSFSLKKVKIIPEDDFSSTTIDRSGGDGGDEGGRPICEKTISFRTSTGGEEVAQVLRCIEFVTSNSTELAVWMTAFINAIEGFYRPSENFEFSKSICGVASSMRDSFVDISLSRAASVDVDGNPSSEQNDRVAVATAARLASRNDRKSLGTVKVISETSQSYVYILYRSLAILMFSY